MSLRESIAGILSNAPAQVHVREYVRIALQLATAYLYRKHARGSLHPNLLGMSVDDIAVDCIASLFERDDRGTFVRLRNYYAALNWDAFPDEELLASTRRLVFGCVNQQLSHLYSDADPSLDKLLRNLRNAMVHEPRLVEEKRGRETWIALGSEKTSSHLLPPMPPEMLEGLLIPHLQERTSLQEVLHLVADLFEDQDIYHRGLPLIHLALSIRSAFVCAGVPEDATTSANPTALSLAEINRMIAGSVRRIRHEKQDSYVTRGKIDGETYEAYFRTIRDILYAEFVENDGHEASFQKFLSTHMPGLTKQSYQQDHRCHLEYLAKLTRREFLATTRKEL